MNEAVSILSQHGKTFRFAGYLLSENTLLAAARLYQFCRYADDIADESEVSLVAKKQLTQIQQDLIDDKSTDNKVMDFIVLAKEYKIKKTAPLTLIEGVMSDLSPVLIKHENDLIRYAYQVAGVVGEMMCPLLQADLRGESFAIDLGIAMQLTNIARDVLDDAYLGRRYLPASWCPLTPKEIINADNSQRKLVQTAIKQVLALAEVYYQSARSGYAYLPRKNSRAIAVAGEVYRQIGVKLNHYDCAFWLGRCVIPTHKKILVAIITLIKLLLHKPTQKPHQPKLHVAFSGLINDKACMP
jgi:phytoene synthase